MSKHILGGSHATRRKANTHLNEKFLYEGDIHVATSIELIQYNGKQFLTKSVLAKTKLKELIDVTFVNWFKVTGISDVDTINHVCLSFGLNKLDVKDLLSAKQVTKITVSERTTFILIREHRNNAQDIQSTQIAFILGDNYIISFQEAPEPIFDDIKEAIQDSRVQIRENKADYLLYILLSNVYSINNETIMKISDRIEEVEDDLINDTEGDIDIMRFIQVQKRVYTLLKRSIISVREELVNILHNSNKLIKEENLVYFRDYDDKLKVTLDDLEIYHLSIGSLSDFYFNKNNLQMNYIIKKLTIVSTIFIPLTFVVGVWGMNFELMPELKWRYGYLFAWGIMFLIIILAIFFLRRKRWV